MGIRRMRLGCVFFFDFRLVSLSPLQLCDLMDRPWKAFLKFSTDAWRRLRLDSLPASLELLEILWGDADLKRNRQAVRKQKLARMGSVYFCNLGFLEAYLDRSDFLALGQPLPAEVEEHESVLEDRLSASSQ